MSEILNFSLHERLFSEVKTHFPAQEGDWNEFCRKNIFLSFGENRHEVIAGTEDKEFCTFIVPSIRELFRGDRNPGEFSNYPPEYVPFFYSIERAVVWAEENQVIDSASDDVFIEIYSAMRRRPDGRSLGPLHDIIWHDAMCFLLTHECSEAEYIACFQRLERSARAMHIDWSSHNYLNNLMNQLS